MDTELKILLDKIYELEGLLHLTLKRDDNTNDFLRLIKSKGHEIGEITSRLKIDNFQKTEPRKEESGDSAFSFDEYTIDEELSDSPRDNDTKNDTDGTKIASQNEQRQKGKLVFTINEKYRFRRELFRNSDIEFNNNLALIASMEDYEEAENYFINELEFDKNHLPVKEFLEIIKRYFK